ncbi:MAG: MAF flag10 domain containing protein, partial [Candidatus Altiarchaeota archaeon]|nr:MAF flag10 domain containing protein [Candidatus Altiarchaeota archaeon]MBU4437426.1 MAF flag10 domain containing protein [Candidatus Altiarchaeota archaeon]
KVHNFRGFTDGDRAAFLADRFGAELIVLAGMDFGDEIGKFSGSYDRERKLEKLRIGKGLLEKLARESRAGILNLTSGGEELAGIPRTSVKALRELV